MLVLSPWNFPVNLNVVGIAAAVSAGNCVVCKPSEVAPATELLLLQLAKKYLDYSAIRFVAGGIPVATELLKLRWDHILYTGNGMVGKIVARAAAEFLTPITLELGGKSPVFVLKGANVQVAARRILSGKYVNAGQVGAMLVEVGEVAVASQLSDYVMVEDDLGPTLFILYGFLSGEDSWLLLRVAATTCKEVSPEMMVVLIHSSSDLRRTLC